MPVRRWLLTLAFATAVVVAVVVLATGESQEERQAKYQRCVLESIIGVNTSAGELAPETRERIRELRRNAKDCDEP